MSIAVLDTLCWPLAVLLLGRSLTVWWRGSFLARNGRRITRQGQPGQFWTEVAGCYLMAIGAGVAAWTHAFAHWAR